MKYKYFLQLYCVLLLNWIVWNRNFYLYKNWFDIKSRTKVDMPQNLNKQTNKHIYIYIYIYIYNSYLMNKVNFGERVCSRKKYLQLNFFLGNQKWWGPFISQKTVLLYGQCALIFFLFMGESVCSHPHRRSFRRRLRMVKLYFAQL